MHSRCVKQHTILRKEVMNEKHDLLRQRAMPIDHVLPMINDGLNPAHGQIKFICQWFIAYAINHTPFHYPAITLVWYPFINEICHLRAGYLRVFSHLRFRRLTVLPLFPDFFVRVLFRDHVRVVTVTFAIDNHPPRSDVIRIASR